MQVIPAIDVLDGKVVRLAQGDFARVTTFGDDPLAVAAQYRLAGAARLHLVNLSAAKSGAADDRFLQLIAEISRRMEVQVGGGIRDLRSVQGHLDAGAAAVVIGTMLFADPGAARAAVDLFGAAHVIAALDVQGEQVKTHGWQQDSGQDLAAAMHRIDELGIRQVLMTDISRDGMGAGPNVALYAEWKRRLPEVEITASGGVRNEADLAALEAAGCEAAVVGRALLEGFRPRYDAPRGGADILVCPEKYLGRQECLSHRIPSGPAIRVIPCLDVTRGRVVKGTNFQNLRDAGDPVELARRYCDEGADELVFLDITATSDERDTLAELASRVADAVNIPFTIGGGVRSVADARRLLEAGADKVTVNSAAVARLALIEEMAAQLGSANTVCAIDARRVVRNVARTLRVRDSENETPSPPVSAGGACGVQYEWTVLVRGGRDDAGIDAVAWAEEAARRGAGELLVTSHDRDGTAAGFDTALLSRIKAVVSVPLIASGGGGSLDTFVDAVRLGKADAVLAASVFHFGTFSIHDVKAALHGASLPIRP